MSLIRGGYATIAGLKDVAKIPPYRKKKMIVIFR